VKNCEHEHEDEFDYRAALERLDSARPTYGTTGEITSQMAVCAEVQAQALVSIVKSLRRITSHLCDNAGESTSATTEEDTDGPWLAGVAPRR